MKIAVHFAVGMGTLGALLFLPAGRLDWGAGWVYLALVLGCFIGNLLYLRRVNPAVVEARSRLTGPGTKTWDRVWIAVANLVVMATWVVAAHEGGRGGAAFAVDRAWCAGLVLLLLGNTLFVRAMGENPFFEKSVRIQTDRGHRVVDTGPYAVVRHPGYVGFVLGWILSVPLLLGSRTAFLPAVLSAVVVVVRTALEDRTLREELPGYAEYAARVRHRLVPGIW